MISTGKLDRRITIQEVSETRDEAGDVIRSWADSFKCWARRQDSQGREFFGAIQMVHDADTIFTVRSSDQTKAIAPEFNRIICDGRECRIVANVEGAQRNDIRLILASSRPDQRGPQAPVPEDG